jgi:lipoprotein-releasing system ATP-binding protein
MLLEVAGVARSYPTADGAVPVLSGVDLQLPEGESVAIVGPSGSGKSTLLNIIGTLDSPDAGHVRLEGRDLTALDETARAAVRAREIGFIFQLHHLLPQCTALENVLVPTLALGGATAARRCPLEPERSVERARRLLTRVGLEGRMGHRPGQLSGGERQRVAVVRALINRPRLVLADEPTGSLDRAAADDLGQLLVALNREEGVSLVVVTHAASLAARMARVLELRDGKLAPV